MKMTTIQAQSIMGISSLSIGKLELKKRYKSEMFKAHPDRGGDKQQTQLLNQAYSLLKKVVTEPVERECAVDEMDCPFFEQEDSVAFAKNVGHPLHNSGLAALKTFDELLHEAFDIRGSDNSPDIRYWNDVNYSKLTNSGVYFTNGDVDMVLKHYSGQLEVMYLSDISNGMLHRKKCGHMTIVVERYSKEYTASQECLSNVLRDWLGESGEREQGFHWCEFYAEVIKVVSETFRNNQEVGLLFGKEVRVTPSEYYVFDALLDIDGSRLKIRFDEVPSQQTFNPFKLERVKPLTKLPRKWKINDLVKVLVNGQFHSLKRNYYYTDDYAYDAAVGFRKGYIENPLSVAFEWFGETKRSCTSLYESSKSTCNGVALNFGFHSNDSSTLVVDLDNRYSLVSLDDDVLYLEEQLRLSA